MRRLGFEVLPWGLAFVAALCLATATWTVGPEGGCGGSPPVVETDPYGGTPVPPGGFPSLVKIIYPNRPPCSGTLVGAVNPAGTAAQCGAILTARHCMPSGGNEAGGTVAFPDGTTYPITGQVAHQSTDLSIFYTRGVPSNPVLPPLAKRRPNASDTVTAYGYGMTDPQDAAGAKPKYTSLRVGGFYTDAESAAVVQGSNYYTTMHLNPSGPYNLVCPGDAGGPSLSGDGQLMGVHSYSVKTNVLCVERPPAADLTPALLAAAPGCNNSTALKRAGFVALRGRDGAIGCYDEGRQTLWLQTSPQGSFLYARATAYCAERGGMLPTYQQLSGLRNAASDLSLLVELSRALSAQFVANATPSPELWVALKKTNDNAAPGFYSLQRGFVETMADASALLANTCQNTAAAADVPVADHRTWITSTIATFEAKTNADCTLRL